MAYKLFGSYEAVHFGVRRRTGAMCVSYRRVVLPWLSIGLTAGFENETRDLTYGYGAIGKYSRSCFSLSPECQLIYKHRGIITYYGFLGIGNAFITGKYTS